MDIESAPARQATPVARLRALMGKRYLGWAATDEESVRMRDAWAGETLTRPAGLRILFAERVRDTDQRFDIDIAVDNAAGTLTLRAREIAIASLEYTRDGGTVYIGPLALTRVDLAIKWATEADPTGYVRVLAATGEARDVAFVGEVASAPAAWSAAHLEIDNLVVKMRAPGTGAGTDLSATALGRVVADVVAHVVDQAQSALHAPARVRELARAVLADAGEFLFTARRVRGAGILRQGAAWGDVEARDARLEATVLGASGAAGAPGSPAAAPEVGAVIALPFLGWSRGAASASASGLRANVHARVERDPAGHAQLVPLRVNHAEVAFATVSGLAWDVAVRAASPPVGGVDPGRAAIQIFAARLGGLGISNLTRQTGSVWFDTLTATVDARTTADAAVAFIVASECAARDGRVDITAAGTARLHLGDLGLSGLRTRVFTAEGAQPWLRSLAGWTAEGPSVLGIRADATLDLMTRALAFHAGVASVELAFVARDVGPEHPRLALGAGAQLIALSLSGSASLPPGGKHALHIDEARIQQLTSPQVLFGISGLPHLDAQQVQLGDVRVRQADIGARAGVLQVARVVSSQADLIAYAPPQPSGRQRRLRASTALVANGLDLQRTTAGRLTAQIADMTANSTAANDRREADGSTLEEATATVLTRLLGTHFQRTADGHTAWRIDAVRIESRFELHADARDLKFEGSLHATGTSGTRARDRSSAWAVPAASVRITGTVQAPETDAAFEVELRNAAASATVSHESVAAHLTVGTTQLGPTRVAHGAFALDAAGGGTANELELRLFGTRGRGLAGLAWPTVAVGQVALADLCLRHAGAELRASQAQAAGLQLSDLVLARAAAGWHLGQGVLAIRNLGCASATFATVPAAPDAKRRAVANVGRLDAQALTLTFAPGARPALAAGPVTLAAVQVPSAPGVASLASLTLDHVTCAADDDAIRAESARFARDAASPAHAPTQSPPASAPLALDVTRHLGGAIGIVIPVGGTEVRATLRIHDGHAALDPALIGSERALDRPSPWGPRWLVAAIITETADTIGEYLASHLGALASNVGAALARPGEAAGATALDLAPLARQLAARADAKLALCDLGAPQGHGLMRLAQDAADVWAPEPVATDIERLRETARTKRLDDLAAWVATIGLSLDLQGDGTITSTAPDQDPWLAAGVALGLRAQGTLAAPLHLASHVGLRGLALHLGPALLDAEAITLDGRAGTATRIRIRRAHAAS